MSYITYLTDNPTTRVTAGYPSYPSGGQHNGIDYVLSPSKTIYSCTDGTVYFAGYGTGANASFGYYVAVRLNDGRIAYYAHMAHPPSVTTGQTITAGTPIGIMGATGNVTGAHVHVALKSQEGTGNWTDPSVITGIPNARGTYETEWGGEGPPSPGPDTDPSGTLWLIVTSDHCEYFSELGNVYSNIGFLMNGESYKIIDDIGIQPDGFYWVLLENWYYAVVREGHCEIVGQAKKYPAFAALIALAKRKGKI